VTAESTEKRTSKLKDNLLASPYELCIERAKLYTEIYQECKDDPEILIRAKALAHTLKNKTIFIREEELLVGNETSKNLGDKIVLDLYSYRDFTKKREIKLLRNRKVQPFQIRDEEVEELDKLIPFWKRKALYDNIIFQRMVDEKVIKRPIRQEAYTPNIAIMTGTNEGHLCFGYEKLLKLGYKGIVQEAESFQSHLKKSDPAYREKSNFYEAIKIYYKAASDFTLRFATLAHDMALGEGRVTRKQELGEISAALTKIAGAPPSSFFEAVQCIWFTQNIANIIYYRSVLALGRLDQILWPFYEKDLKAHKITREKALELIEELNLKLTWNCRLVQTEYTMATNALGLNTQTITIGGTDKKGTDVTNDLSYLFLEAYKTLKVFTTDLSVRIHKNTPKEFFVDALKVLQVTSGIAFYNDEVIVPSMLKAGYSLEDARNYVIIGCVEPTSQGNTFAATGHMFMNLPGVLELTLNNGFSNFSKQIDGLETGDPSTFTEFNQLYDAFTRQLRHNVEQAVKIAAIWDEESMKRCQQPFVSATLDDCMKTGKDYTEGGTKYNFSSITAYGFATLVDSFYNIKKIVYDEKLISLPEFIQIINSNFEGKEELRQKLMNRYEKWGNDKEEIDAFANTLWDLFCQEVTKHKPIRGGRFNAGAYSMGLHVLEGFLTAPTADGRKALEPISNSLSPVNKVEKNGITATLNSIAKLNYEFATNGVAVNVRFHSQNIQKEENLEKYYLLFKTYFDLGGMQLQPNVVSTETLKDAQKHPENYPDLVVKVGGYNAVFIDLGAPIQNDIINRQENTVD